MQKWYGPPLSPCQLWWGLYKIWCRYVYPVRNYWHVSKIKDGGGWIFRLYEFGHSDVLILWHLCFVPNLVQISVIVTEIDALMFKTFIWWHHTNMFWFRLLVKWSSPHGRDPSSHKIWCSYLYPVWSYWYFPKLKMAAAAILDFQIMWIWPFGCVDSVVFVLCIKLG